MYSSPAQPLGPEDLVWRMVCYSLLPLKILLILYLFKYNYLCMYKNFFGT